MDKIISQLAAIANELDEKGHSKFADTVDGIANTALDIKVSQYVGVQGYWVRNTRCWGNCLRQKRSSSPAKPSQEVWAECHKEYLESLGSPDATWDKYAGSDIGMIKSASARELFNRSLSRKISSKISSGADLRSSIVAAIDEQGSEEFGNLISASTKLVSIADALSKKDMGLSLKIASVAGELSKTARWWHPADWMGGVGDWAAKNRAGHADKLRQKADEYNNKERGRNNPFMSGQPGGTPGAAAGAAPGPGANFQPPMPAQTLNGPGLPGSGSGMPGNLRVNPNAPLGQMGANQSMTGPGSGGSSFDGDGNAKTPPAAQPPAGAVPPPPSGGQPPASPQSAPAGNDGQISLQPMSEMDNMSPMQASQYYKTLLEAQQRINQQISSLNKMYGAGYRQSKGWGGEPSPAAAPAESSGGQQPMEPDAYASAFNAADAARPPSPGTPSATTGPKPPNLPVPPESGGSNSFMSGPDMSGGFSAGQPMGPTEGFGQHQDILGNPPKQQKPRRRLNNPPASIAG